MAVQIARIFAEIMYNSNSNSYNTSRYTTHNAYNSNRGNINEIVRVSSNSSINAYMTSYCVMRITSGCSWMPTN